MWIAYLELLVKEERKTLNGQVEEDGGGVGWGDHFLPQKFIERTFEC